MSELHLTPEDIQHVYGEPRWKTIISCPFPGYHEDLCLGRCHIQCLPNHLTKSQIDGKLVVASARSRPPSTPLLCQTDLVVFPMAQIRAQA